MEKYDTIRNNSLTWTKNLSVVSLSTRNKKKQNIRVLKERN